MPEGLIILKMDSVNEGSSWSLVAGRHGPRSRRGTPRGTFRGGYRGSSRGGGTRPSKRQRISGESVGSSVSPTQSSKTFSLESFKSLSVDRKLETMFSCLLEVKATNERLLKAEQTFNEIRQTAQSNTRRIDILAYKSIDIESRQRRNNLIFWGLPEMFHEDCTSVISEFLGDKLGLDADTICIQRSHRIGKPQYRQNVIGRSARIKHRPLIVAFRDYQDVELVLSNANKLKNSPYGINRDYPQEIIEARKPLLQEKRTLKQAYPDSHISIQYPAKLIRDGRVVKDMFPDWYKIMKSDRLTSSDTRRMESVSRGDLEEHVFDSNSDFSDTEQGDRSTQEGTCQSTVQVHASMDHSPSAVMELTGSEPLGNPPVNENTRVVQGNLPNATARRPPDDEITSA